VVRGRGGFTLVEVLVALVVLQVGLMGVVGTLLLAARTLGRAEAEEEGVVELSRVLDSLSLGGSSGAGTRRTRAGVVTWSAGGGGSLHVVFSTPRDSALVVVDGRARDAR
jgi:prepilin-type N-terminal cleavage/methylation domain-containing protein